MKTRKPASAVAVVAAPPSEQTLSLQHGRSLALAAQGDDDVVEVRGRGGAVELRFRVTPEGPVLQVAGVRLSLQAARDLEVECENFKVRARAGVELCSATTLRLQADQEVQLDAAGDVRVSGTLIHLN